MEILYERITANGFEINKMELNHNQSLEFKELRTDALCLPTNMQFMAEFSSAAKNYSFKSSNMWNPAQNISLRNQDQSRTLS